MTLQIHLGISFGSLAQFRKHCAAAELTFPAQRVANKKKTKHFTNNYVLNHHDKMLLACVFGQCNWQYQVPD